MKRPVETDEGVRIVPIFGLYVARVAFSSTKLPRCPFCVISHHFPHSSFIRRREPRGLQLLKSGESDARRHRLRQFVIVAKMAQRPRRVVAEGRRHPLDGL